MASERKHSSTPMIMVRIQTAIHTNKKLAFLISIILVSLVYYFASTPPSSPYVSKRHGLGAGDTAGELASALRRKGDGRAAVAILRVVATGGEGGHTNSREDVRYLVQVKSHDYPIEIFRGTVCLLGGNANKHDETPLDTLKRELKEELHNPDWVDDIMDPTKVIDDSNNSTAMAPNDYHMPGTVRYLGTTLHFQSSQAINKPNPYAFMCALYEITLTPDQLPPSVIHPRGANIEEGRVVLLSEDQLVKHSKYAWGYEYTMTDYFERKVVNQQRGTAVSEVDEKTWRETVWTPPK